MPYRFNYLFLAVLCFIPKSLHAQEFRLFDHAVQVHGFASQGFAYSGGNNYLTMNTESGSGAFTDAGVNASIAISDHFRIGAQGYIRDIGQLGEGHPDLDWAYGDYRFADWFGVRAGKIKTVLGLYNDTQDDEFLHTWAILPQSNYPLDLRSATLAHTGADIYGRIALGSAGALSYTAYWGIRSFDKHGGIYYFSADQGVPILKDSGHVEGGDIRWNTPLSGLMLGASGINLTENRSGYEVPPSLFSGTYTLSPDPDYIIAGYGDYRHGHWHLDGEFRREYSPIKLLASFFTAPYIYEGDSNRAFFISAAYQISSRLEIGTYHSRFLIDHPDNPSDPDSHHIYDQTVTMRLDINRWWDFKIEGHFINGYGDVFSARGFYLRSNPNGLRSKTNMLVLRSGISF